MPSYLTREKERPWSPGASSSIGSLLWPKPGLAAPYLKVASGSLPVCLSTPLLTGSTLEAAPSAYLLSIFAWLL